MAGWADRGGLRRVNGLMFSETGRSGVLEGVAGFGGVCGRAQWREHKKALLPSGEQGFSEKPGSSEPADKAALLVASRGFTFVPCQEGLMEVSV